MAETKIKQDRYLGFFLVEGIWANIKPDYSKFGSQYWIKPEYWALMGEISVSINDSDRCIKVSRDGLIQYTDNELSNPKDTDESLKRIEKYTEILNGLYLVVIETISSEMMTNYHTNFEVTHQNIIQIAYEDNDIKIMSLPQKALTSKQLDMRWLNNVPDNAMDNLDSWIDDGRRPVISNAILEKAIKKYFKIASSNENTRLLSRANKAASEFANTSFSDCVLACWLQVEIYLFEKLKAFMISEGATKYNKKRRESLLKSTSAQMIELLEISGQLTKPEYDRLSTVRKTRNEVVHNNHRATSSEASDAMELLENVIKETSGETVVIIRGLSFSVF